MVRDLDLEGHEIEYMPSKDMELLIEELLRFNPTSWYDVLL